MDWECVFYTCSMWEIIFLVGGLGNRMLSLKSPLKMVAVFYMNPAISVCLSVRLRPL